MANIDRRTSKRAIGAVLILGSLLIALGSSTIGNLQPANAVVSHLQAQPNTQSDSYLTHSPTGSAQLLWDGDSTLTVTIDMTGEVASSDIHPASIHKGSCETSDGGVLYPLNPVQAKQSSPSVQQGNNLSTVPVPVEMISSTIIPLVQTGIPSSGWFLSVYNGPTLSPPIQNIPIACADITNLNTSTSASQYVSLDLGPTKGLNQAANGIVTTTLYNNQLVIAITMSGLEPGSTHQADIHQGQCGRSQGPVVHTLTPVAADGRGIGTSKTTMSGIASTPNNWYVNVHLGAAKADMNTQAGLDPFVCGNIGNSPSANAVVPHLQSQLNSQSDSYLTHSPTGDARLLWDKKSTLTVTIDMAGVALGDIYPASIHKGSCETSDNGVLYPLNPVKAQRSSPSTPPVTVSMVSRTIIPLVQTGIPSSGWFLNVYNGPTLSSPTQNIPIACADITNLNTSTSASQYVSLVLGPTKGLNQAANGIATTTLYNNQFVVAITMSGLEPGSTHQADIHQGQCDRSPGPVVHTLTPVAADARGIGTSTTTISGISSIPNNWYVNVHLGAAKADINTQAGLDPFVCGQIEI